MHKLISVSASVLMLFLASYSMAQFILPIPENRSPDAVKTRAQPIILAYFSNWDVHNHYLGSKTPEKDFAFNSKQNLYKLARLNTVAYAFFGAAKDDGTIQSLDAWSDFDSSDMKFCKNNPKICFKNNQRNIDGGYGNFNKFANSGTTSGITNRLIAFGGAGHDEEVEAAMQNPEKFVGSLKLLKGKYNFTGLDFDYEPNGGVPAEYRPKLIRLMKKVRSEMENNFMITYTIISDGKSIDDFGSGNWYEVVRTVDYINIMNYDIFGPWRNNTGLQSPIYLVPNTGGSNYSSAETSITRLKANGVPSRQIILGYPSYGRAVSGTSDTGLGKTFKNFYRGNLDSPSCEFSTSISELRNCGGAISYATIIGIIAKNYPIKNQVQKGVINGSYINFAAETDKGMGNAFVTFDSTSSIVAKVNYAKSEQLAGVMTWGINYDAPALNSDGSLNSASLLNAVNSAYQIIPRAVKPGD